MGVPGWDEGEPLQPRQAPEEGVGADPHGAAVRVERLDVSVQLVPPRDEAVELLLGQLAPSLEVFVQ